MVKKILFLTFLCCFFSRANAQQQVKLDYDQGFIYTIQLQGVTDFVTAKEIAWVLQDKFKFFPHFDDQHDRFEFYSNLEIAQDPFTADMVSRGYNVIQFLKEACAPCQVKEQEQ